MRGQGKTKQDVVRKRMLQGASLVAMLVAGFAAAPAAAQVLPGSAQCPIVSRIVTCSGSIPQGISVPAGGDRDGLTVENIASDIVLTTRPAIQFTAGTPTTTIRIGDPDNVLRVTTTTPDTNGRDVNLSVILATATNNTNFSLLSDIDIFGRTICPRTSCFQDRSLQVVGITVRGSLGNFTIENRGDISIDSDEDAVFSRSAAIVADVRGADLVSIRNTGTLTVRNGGGIIATADNRRIEITNDGNITVNEDDDVDTSTDGGISLQFESFQNYSDGFTRPDVPQLTDFTYRIVNNGSILTSVVGDYNFNPGILVSHTYIEQLFPVGSNQSYAGRQIGEIVNNGTIGGNYGGIFVEQNGDLTLTNNGRVQGQLGISISQTIVEIANPGVVSTTRVVNSASGVIDVLAPGATLGTVTGIDVTGGIIDISNAGRINVIGADVVGVYVIGPSASSVIRPLQLVTFTNSGQLTVSGEFAVAFALNRNNPATANRAPDQRTVINNSGTIAATGDGADGISLLHRTTSSDASLANIGTVEINLVASSIVRGGTTDGTGIRIIAGERSMVLNAGLITATSGLAIVAGSGPETIDNSGRIEGSVALGSGNDRVIARLGGLITGAVDGGDGSDTLAFDVASGNALIGDRIGGVLSGFELLEKTGAGTLALTQTPAARTALLGGTLVTTGNLSAMAVDASAGTTLNATGNLGAVGIASGGTLSAGGESVGTINLASLTLASTSRLRFDLGAPGTVGGAVNDLIAVSGNVTLDGLLDVNAQAGFGNGVYRLINYGGTLTDNGLTVGLAPANSYQAQTSVAGQINLVVGLVPTQFWDGAGTTPDGMIAGGSGTWNNTTTNWTRSDGSINESWGSQFAVFQATPGTVTIDASGVSASGLQFAVSGYRIEGGALTLTGPATIRVGDGTAGGASFTATIASSIGGTEGVEKTDLGTLVLTGTNGFTGGLRVTGGAVQVSSDAALGTAAGGVTLDGGRLTLSGAFSSARGFTIGAAGGTIDTGANAVTWSGALSGGGALGKAGSGTLTYTGNGSALTGTTRVNAGALVLNGSLGGAVIVASGATLSGTGSAASLDIAGIIAPGNSVGTLTITGDVTFRAGSSYRAELSASGGADRINTGGRAIIEGGTVAITALDPETSYTTGTNYRILNGAGGLTGTFTGLTETSAFLDFALGYDATSVTVSVTVVRTFPDVAITYNQRQSSRALAAFGQGAGTDSLAVYNAILLLDTGPARAAFDAASGEIYATTVAASQRNGIGLADRLIGRANGESEEGLGIWGGISGQDGAIDSDGNGGRFSHNGIGGEFGLDYRGTNNRWAIGIAGGYRKGDVSLVSRNSSADLEAWHVGGYVRFGGGGKGPTATLSGAYLSGTGDVDRSIAIGALAPRRANAKADVSTTAFAGELRYGFSIGHGWAIGPVARASYADTRLGRFSETGAGSLNLSGGAGNRDDRTRYGGGLFARWESKKGSIDATLGYLGGGGSATDVSLLMAGAGGTPYRVRAARGDGDTGAFSLAGRYELGGGWAVGAAVEGAYGRAERNLAGNATLRWRF